MALFTETSCGVHNKKESRSTGIAQIGLEPDSASREWGTETVNGRLEIDGAPLEAPAKLRPLTTLKWPAVPPPPALIDPLTVNDPKPLQLPHYEAIATSTQVREALQTNPKLPAILRALDKLEGDERVRALEAVLGVLPNGPPTPALTRGRQHPLSWLPSGTDEDDLSVLGQFMETLGTTIVQTGRRNDDGVLSIPGLDPVALEVAELD